MRTPVNEMGVVALFSQYAQSMGYVIMEIQAPFPDATLYEIETANLIYAEFEYKAKNFYKHKHDPEKCDLIICWENDWADSPLPVIEMCRIHDKEPIEKLYELQKKEEELRNNIDDIESTLWKAEIVARDYDKFERRVERLEKQKKDIQLSAYKYKEKYKDNLVSAANGRLDIKELKQYEILSYYLCKRCKAQIAPIMRKKADERWVPFLYIDGMYIYLAKIRCECGKINHYMQDVEKIKIFYGGWLET